MQVRFDDVSLRFGDKTVLNHISFNLPDRALTSFLGPSGSGKSTTLYLISGLLEVSSGRIFFDDRDVTDLDPVKRNIGLVFQNYALYPHMTVLDNIMYPLKIAKVPKADRVQRAKKMAELTQIADQLDKFPSQLSGGQQQRVAISRALVKEPSVLLMDEPLSNLDARLRIEMRREIRRIQQETGITTIFVTHDQEEALSIADNVMILNEGEIQQMSDPVSLYAQPENLFVAKFIGSPVINIFQPQSPNLLKHKILDKDAWQYLGVRPEHLIMTSADEALLKGQVSRIEQVGKDVTIYLQGPGEDFVWSQTSSTPVEVGQELFFKVADQNLLRFDKQGRRVEEANHEPES
ncbi:ABC transporter ATP-binding protein [Ignavigranum ruoffiae]|uniref:ABC transporter ATP-binding protein n=1 Tax=Ignavigranum ruoffiae TaxID=89093 RepID=UPI0023522AC5|nr:ABC transporter ATP-binding protein [Ignavigranum ruoffiae]